MFCHFIGKVFAQTQTGAVDADAVDVAVGTSKVDVFKGAGIELRIFSALAAKEFAVLRDEDSFTRSKIANEVVFQTHHRDGFGAYEIVGRTVGLLLRAEAKRTDAIGIAESEKTLAGNQSNHRVGALDALVHAFDGLESHFGGEVARRRNNLHEFVGQYIEQHFRVARSIDVATVLVVELCCDFLRVGEVTVVSREYRTERSRRTAGFLHWSSRTPA